MDERTGRWLDNRIKRADKASLKRMLGKVRSTVPLVVEFGNSEVTAMSSINYRPRVNDRVLIIKKGMDAVVVGSVGPGKTGGYIPSTTGLTLGTSNGDIGGCTFTTDQDGLYEVHATIAFWMIIAGAGLMTGRLLVDGVDHSSLVYHDPASGTWTGLVSVAQTWEVEAASGDVIKLQAKKANAGGTAVAVAAHTTMLVRKV